MIAAMLSSTTLVAVAEIGDKTQLLSFVLAARLKRPWPIIAGILVATLANHAFAASIGVWLASLVSSNTMAVIVGAAFVIFGLWTLRPDSLDFDEGHLRAGAFVATLVAFFFVEMGDKTQLATVALAARYPTALVSVVAGTTLGMLAANAPAVLLGEALSERLPFRYIRWVAAALFVAMGAATLVATIS
jgi:putative Ca2+/H+ antiporter (TMEM165/GDT1 family)